MPGGVSGIWIQASDVSLDLNGFAILGPRTCAGWPVSSCSGGTNGYGVESTYSNTRVTNGSVAGMFGGLRLRGESARVERVTAHDNNFGMDISHGEITHCQATRNETVGIFGRSVSHSQVLGNGTRGIQAVERRISDSLAAENGADGIYVHVGVVRDNLAGTASLVLPALPANLAAYHYTGSVHWLVFETTVALPGGITAGPRDIVAWNGVAYSLLFDGAAAGIPAGVVIDALATLSGTVGGVNYNDEDVLEFAPGANTWELAYNSAAACPAWAPADLKTLWSQAAVAGTPPVMGNVPDQNATVGSAFSLALAGYVTPTEGDPITGYAIASGALPPGLTLAASTGVITGTPTTVGTYNITVVAGDKDGWSNADAIRFIVVAAPANGSPTPVPTLSGWGTMLLSVLLAGLALRRQRRESGPRAGHV